MFTPAMFTSQAVADVALLLTRVMSVEEADGLLTRALRRSGLATQPTVNAEDLQRLLVALAAEGGPVEQVAMQIAIHGLDGLDGSPGGTRP